jgi:hypothetical protein
MWECEGAYNLDKRRAEGPDPGKNVIFVPHQYIIYDF